jgi:hypothetical protein
MNSKVSETEFVTLKYKIAIYGGCFNITLVNSFVFLSFFRNFALCVA